MRIVFSLASTCRLLLSMPGKSIIARRSLPSWKTLMGGTGPGLVVWSCSQSLAKRASSARCRLNNASKGSTKAVIMVALRLVIPRRCIERYWTLFPASAAMDLVLALALSRADCQKFHADYWFKNQRDLGPHSAAADRALRAVGRASVRPLKIPFVFSTTFAHPHH